MAVAKEFHVGYSGGRKRHVGEMNFRTQLPEIVDQYRPQQTIGLEPNVTEVTEYLDESRITSASQPYIRVEFNPYVNIERKKFYAEKTEISSAEIGGKTNVSRKGTVEIRDPEGFWPHILTEVGRTSNSFTQQRHPNIRLTFGWTGLGPGRGGGGTDGRRSGASNNPGANSFVTSLDGMITKVEFDLGADGTNVVRIEFIETYLEVLNRIRFLYPEDLQKIHTKNRERRRGGFDGTLDILRYLCQTKGIGRNNLKIQDDIERSGLKINFEGESVDEIGTLEVKYGDFLIDVINNLITKMIHPTAEDKNNPHSERFDFRYERTLTEYEGEQTIDIENGESHTFPTAIITYDWKKTLKDESAGSMSESLPPNSKTGPALLWKRQGDPTESKTLVEWNSDLSSATHLLYSANEELSKNLNAFQETDWKVVNDLMQQYGDSWYLEENVQVGAFNGFFRRGENEERREIVENFREKAMVIEETAARGNTVSNTLRSIIRDNVFKGTAKIIGDPSIGTSFIPWHTIMYVNFDSVNVFASLFSKWWMLTDTKHVFSEGSYITEIQLQTYPNLDEMAEEMAISDLNHADAVMHLHTL